MRTNCWAAALALGTATITLTSAVGAGQLKDVAPTSASPINVASLVGAWTLTAADDLNPDGTRVHAYGNNPRGLLIFDSGGRYSVQIFRENRLKFASGDKRQGTLEEYRDATLGMSSHFGHYTVNPSNQTITFTIDRASFPQLGRGHADKTILTQRQRPGVARPRDSRRKDANLSVAPDPLIVRTQTCRIEDTRVILRFDSDRRR